jgi:hypothetical protein
MSETPMDSTGTGQDDDLQQGGHGLADGGADPVPYGGADGGADGDADADAGGGADAGAGPVSDLAKGDDVSTGTDGVGGGNDSRSSVLEDTLGAGGDQDDVDGGR